MKCVCELLHFHKNVQPLETSSESSTFIKTVINSCYEIFQFTYDVVYFIKTFVKEQTNPTDTVVKLDSVSAEMIRAMREHIKASLRASKDLNDSTAVTVLHASAKGFKEQLSAVTSVMHRKKDTTGLLKDHLFTAIKVTIAVL